MGAVLASLGPVTQAPECLQSFPQGASGPESKGHLRIKLFLTLWSISLWVGERGERPGMVPSHYQRAFPSATHVVFQGQLGLKLPRPTFGTRQPATPTPGPVSANTVQMTLQSFLARPFLWVQARRAS